MLPADPSVAADVPDLTGTAIVHNQRYDESVLLGPLANYTTRDKYTSTSPWEVDQCSAEAGWS